MEAICVHFNVLWLCFYHDHSSWLALFGCFSKKLKHVVIHLSEEEIIMVIIMAQIVSSKH